MIKSLFRLKSKDKPMIINKKYDFVADCEYFQNILHIIHNIFCRLPNGSCYKISIVAIRTHSNTQRKLQFGIEIGIKNQIRYYENLILYINQAIEYAKFNNNDDAIVDLQLFDLGVEKFTFYLTTIIQPLIFEFELRLKYLNDCVKNSTNNV